VPIARLHVDDLQLDYPQARCETEIEVLTACIPANVDPRLTAPGTDADVHTCADDSEATFEGFAGHSVSSLAAGKTEGGKAGRSRASVHLPTGARRSSETARFGVAVSSVTPGPSPNDVFQATRPTLRPWIVGRVAYVRAGRRPTWRGFGARSSVTGRINRTLKHTLLYRVPFPASRESFSLRRGLDFDLTFVQAEHHLWFKLADRLRNNEGDPLGRPRLAGYAARGLARIPRSEG
jgi:hypothetical protein